MDWVISKLDSDGKICDMKFYDYEENEFDLDSVDKIYDELDGERIYFEDGIDDVLETFKGQRANKNLHIELLGSVPKIGSINEQSEYEKYFHEWQMDFFKKNVDEDGRYKFNSIEGPYPSAAQNGFCYPEIDDSESSFIYVGSYYAYDFGGIGAHYYVFFHPSERIVAQLMQIT